MIDGDLVSRARAADLLSTVKALGGAGLKRVSASELTGPCPKCGGRDRFAVNVKRKIWNCRGCGRGGGPIDLVMNTNNVDFLVAVAFLACESTPPKPARVRPAASPDNGDNQEKALALWREGVDPHGTRVEIYLLGRELKLDHRVAGEVLRWHPRTRAMLALFRSTQTGRPQALSRTFFDRDGKKLERRFLGPVWGAAVMLDAFDEVLGSLHVCEGVETGMAARQLGLRPCWALGSASAVAAFPILGGVQSLTLLQENDDASERACEASAARWHAAGREVFINQPTAGKDLNDAIRGAP
jgi:hypothetical protein